MALWQGRKNIVWVIAFKIYDGLNMQTVGLDYYRTVIQKIGNIFGVIGSKNAPTAAS